MKAIASRNQLTSAAKKREAEKAQIQGNILERQAQLARLRAEHVALTKVQTEQEQFIERFMMQK